MFQVILAVAAFHIAAADKQVGVLAIPKTRRGAELIGR